MPANRLAPQELSLEVLLEKYAKNNETSIHDIRTRVSTALARHEADPALWAPRFYAAMDAFVPAGRIQSAAGTAIQATLINCFVQPIADSISEEAEVAAYPSIYVALLKAAETMRRGGGVGYDFSRIRPKGALVKGTHSRASGPISFMRVYDRSCETVESAGARRGAQMGILRCDHPDIEEFIHAKDKGDLKNFNISVAVTDALMLAVEKDSMFELTHTVEPHPDYYAQHSFKPYQRLDGKWVYRQIKASEIWNQIMESTYDHAEPGVVFIDRINADNNLYYCEIIEATNPCVVGSTRLATQYGLVPIQQLHAEGLPLNATVDNRALGDTKGGVSTRSAVPAFLTSHSEEVFKVETKEGYEITATAWHDFYTLRGKLPLSELKVGDEILVQSGKGQFGAEGSADLGQLLGLITGDGHFTDRDGQDAAVVSLWNEDRALAPAMAAFINKMTATLSKTDRVYAVSPTDIDTRNCVQIRSVLLARWLAEFGFNRDTKLQVPSVVWRGTEACVRGYLQALFQTDGTVAANTASQTCSVRLASVHKPLLQEVQQLLANFGILSSIYLRRVADSRPLPDGKGGTKLYHCQDAYELIIDGASRDLFMREIAFLLPLKNEKYQNWAEGRSLFKKAQHTATITSIQSAGVAPVYDTTQVDHNTVIFNGLVTGQCAEQPLPPYGCCCLGSINLSVFVRNPFEETAYFDFQSLADLVPTAIRMLDNVLAETYWPLPEQQREAQNKRRIGLGFLGLGDTLVMLGQRYDSDEGRETARQITEIMRDSAYLASSDIAVEKGSFPLLDADKLLQSGFAKRLPDHIKDRIRTNGLRNSHLLSIAPTGTITLAFADNASNGIEPAFTWQYTRKKRMPDGSTKEYSVEDFAWRTFKHKFGPDAPLTPAFVDALSMSATDHMKMMEVVQPYVDSAISKTVNVPADYPYNDFKNLYLHAWKAGLKGLATYRPNSVLGSVLSVTAPAPVVVPAAPLAPTLPDINPLTLAFEKRPLGDLEGVTRTVEYFTSEGKQSLYLTVNFLIVHGRVNGTPVEIERPIEFFIPSSQKTEDHQWIASNMRMLSLLGRSGSSLARALKNMREVVWDKGPVRSGTYHRHDGYDVPLYHKSEVAAIGYALQQILIKRGFLDADGNEVPLSALERQANQKHTAYEDQNLLAEPPVESPTPVPAPAEHSFTGTGKPCPECGAHALHKVDGCTKCTNCGYVGACG